jgi:hypothetical protein
MAADDSALLDGHGFPFCSVVGRWKFIVQQHGRRADEDAALKDAFIGNVRCALDFASITNDDSLPDVSKGTDRNVLADGGVVTDVTGPPCNGMVAQVNPFT